MEVENKVAQVVGVARPVSVLIQSRNLNTYAAKIIHEWVLVQPTPLYVCETLAWHGYQKSRVTLVEILLRTRSGVHRITRMRNICTTWDVCCTKVVWGKDWEICWGSINILKEWKWYKCWKGICDVDGSGGHDRLGCCDMLSECVREEECKWWKQEN